MNSKKEKLLNDTYHKWIQTGLYDLPLDQINEFINPKIMGYGSAIDEKVLSISDYRELINRQREQAVGLEMSFEITPVFRSISNKEDSAIFVDEIKVSIVVNGDKQELFLRMTTILEYIDSKWIVVHWHGSMPTETTAETDAWLVNEWQRKNDELQKLVEEKTSELLNKNRELEIETALEKVRSSALAMREPTDMLDVCRIISDQLQSLGVNEIRNVQTAIFYETKKTYLNFEYYTKHNKTLITEVDYRTHELQESFASKMMKGVEELFSETLRSQELKDWYAYQKTTNQFADSFLETAESLSYYWYSLGPVALGMSTYAPLNEQEINLFKRFRNVFELAYRRFMDIQQAEAQAKEAKIEAALEKARAVAMSMNKPDDLLNICEVLFKEFHKLGFDEIRNAMINIHNDEKGTFQNYDYSDEIGKSINHLTYNIHPVIEKQIKQIRSANDAFSETSFTGKDLEDWKEFRNKIGEKDDPRINESSALYYYFYSIGTGSIGISTFSSINAEKLELLKRFRNVFSLSYQRFMDIALAEAQAREAQNELALERVRARTMAMHHSSELSETAAVLFQQLNELGYAPDRTTIGIVKEDVRSIELWSTDQVGNKISNIFKASIDEPTTWSKIYSAWKAKKRSLVIDLSGKELIAWIRYVREEMHMFVNEEVLKENRRVHSIAFFSQGFIIMSTIEPLPIEKINVLERFALVFNQTYTRFLDLQKAEAQAREAQIQLALERVRAKTMAMQKSDELGEVASLLFQQVRSLGIESYSSGFTVWENNDKDLVSWMCNANGSINPPFRMPVNEIKWHQQQYESWKKKDDYVIHDFTGEEMQGYYKYLRSFPLLNEAFKKSEAAGIVTPAHQVHNVFNFSNGNLLFITLEPVSDAYEIFKRFASVFDQTYTRFLDLQKAEAQAKEAKIEAALERVRSRSMGMQKSDELKEVIQVVYEQFVHLNIKVEHTGFVIDYKARDDYNIWIADPLGVPSQVTVPYFDSVYYNRFNEAKEKGEDFFATNLSFEEKNKFYQKLFEYIPGLPEEAKEFYFSCPGLAGSTVLLDNVCLYIENFSGTPYSDEENATLMRFAKVFQQTYTRFLDLKKAEAQAREAQIEAALEKVRSRTMAMHQGDELADTSMLLFEQLLKLGIKPRTCGFLIMDDESESMEDWSSHIDEHGKVILVIGKIAYYQHPLITRVVESWRKGDPYFIGELHGEELQKYYQAVTSKETSSRGINDQVLVNTISEYTNSFYFNYGMMYVLTPTTLSEFETEIMLRFAGVFKSTYTRFLDLKKAEAQAREAQIEAALERVRSRTMAMQQSDELAETSAVVFKQLINLGVEPNRIYIAIIKDETGICEFWITDEDGSKVSTVFKADLAENASFNKMYEGWKKQEKSITIDMQGKELEEYFKHLSKINVPFKGGLSQKRRIQNIAYFSKGFIGIASPDLLQEETKDLLKRFAAVFNLTYTRFNDLKQAEAQNKIIQAENDRKTKELEDARQLQLSMLPKELPKLPHLDIAVYMKTATEVGGDYYDFYVQPDGTLTILVGDATGHGMMSGMMVSIMKSFFISNRMNIELKHFFENSNSSIKDMHLGRLMMPLMGVQITSEKVIATNAGMPSLLYFRNKSQKAGEFVSNNMPLGAMKGTKYLLKEIKYEKGDTLLLMTDGFAELKNENDKQYGYARVKEEFKSVAKKDPDEIVDHLKNSASQWINGVEPDDDVTFVVIKVK